jgi:pSer/pThr/pTyr-binding forkhead associated (FHA) protein
MQSEAAPQSPAPVRTATQPFCPKCQKALPPGSRFCGFCGAPLPVAAPPAPPKPVEAPSAAPAAVASPAAKPAPPRPAAPPVAARPPAPAAAKPEAPAPAAAAEVEGTKVFAGLHTPTTEVTLVEVKQDGTTGETVRVAKEITIGRENCDVNRPHDNLLAKRHAALEVRGERAILKDLGSQNGTFLKQRQDAELFPGDVFLLGRELFRFATEGAAAGSEQEAAAGTQFMVGAPKLAAAPVKARLEQIRLTGEVVRTFPLDKPETTLGRIKGDWTFRDDPFMSGTHARIAAKEGRFILQDLKSRNGIYRRIRKEVELGDGDEFFLGEQLFRVQIKTG